MIFLGLSLHNVTLTISFMCMVACSEKQQVLYAMHAVHAFPVPVAGSGQRSHFSPLGRCRYCTKLLIFRPAKISEVASAHFFFCTAS